MTDIDYTRCINGGYPDLSRSNPRVDVGKATLYGLGTLHTTPCRIEQESGSGGERGISVGRSFGEPSFTHSIHIRSYCVFIRVPLHSLPPDSANDHCGLTAVSVVGISVFPPPYGKTDVVTAVSVVEVVHAPLRLRNVMRWSTIVSVSVHPNHRVSSQSTMSVGCAILSPSPSPRLSRVGVARRSRVGVARRSREHTDGPISGHVQW